MYTTVYIYINVLIKFVRNSPDVSQSSNPFTPPSLCLYLNRIVERAKGHIKRNPVHIMPP